MIWVNFLIFLGTAEGVLYDTFTGNPVSPWRTSELTRMNMLSFCTLDVKECDPLERRRLDYSCNNLNHPPLGAMFTPYSRLLPPAFSATSDLRPSQSGEPLPNARSLRVSLMSDGRASSDLYTQMVTNMAIFVTADVTSVHDTVNYVTLTITCCASGPVDPRCIPIAVADDDVHLRRSDVRCLNLTRPIFYQSLGCAPFTLPPERINVSPPMLEMSIVYGNGERGAQGARTRQGGRLLAEQIRGKDWPPTGGVLCLNNEPPVETRCHDSPQAGANSVLGINLIFIWMYRNHNKIASALAELNPCWDDEKLFFTARDINIAIYQNILYYEFFPQILGYEHLLKNKVIFNTLGHVDDYDDSLEPKVSIEYVTGTRWFHTLQEGRVNMYDNGGKLTGALNVVDLNLRTGALPINNTIEGITQGAFRQPSAAADYVLDPDIGERILGRLQFASDVVSNDIMKGRAVGLPPYNMYRKLCGLPEAYSFEDLYKWMPVQQVEAIESAYETVEDLDIMVGILAEKPMPGAVMGPTLACIMTEQLQTWRRADRFWYENSVHPGAYTPEQLLEIRRTTFAHVMCENGDNVDAIQPHAFLLPSHRNQIVKCSQHPGPDYRQWKDPQCLVSTNTTPTGNMTIPIDFF